MGREVTSQKSLARWIVANQHVCGYSPYFDQMKVFTVLRAIRENWPIEKLIININDDMDILGGFIAATDEQILSRHYCSGIIG